MYFQFQAPGNTAWDLPLTCAPNPIRDWKRDLRIQKKESGCGNTVRNTDLYCGMIRGKRRVRVSIMSRGISGMSEWMLQNISWKRE